MRAIRAEFIESAKPPRYAWWVLAAVAMVPLALLWDTHRMQEERSLRQQAAQDERARVAAAQVARQVAEVERTRNSPQAVQRRALMALREVAWPEALATLEATPRGALTIDSIQVDVSGRSVAVQAKAPDHQSVIDYLGQLNDGLPPGELRWRWHLKEVRLQSHGNSYSVSIVADWGRG